MADASAIVRLNAMIAPGPVSVRIAQVFPLHQAAARRALEEHHVGKLILQMAP